MKKRKTISKLARARWKHVPSLKDPAPAPAPAPAPPASVNFNFDWTVEKWITAMLMVMFGFTFVDLLRAATDAGKFGGRCEGGTWRGATCGRVAGWCFKYLGEYHTYCGIHRSNGEKLYSEPTHRIWDGRWLPMHLYLAVT